MPRFHRYQNKTGGYIIATVKGQPVTYQLTPRGESTVNQAGVLDGGAVSASLLNKLRKLGDAYTPSTFHQTKPQMVDPQLEFPF